MKKPSVTILYHFFHPDDVVGARQFSDFAQELAQRGWDVTVLTSNRCWGHPKAKIATARETWHGVRIIRVPRFGWNQANDLLRIGNALWIMMGWLIRLLRLPRTDVIIVGSDPQFSQLLFPAIKALIRPKTLAYWCFDLFPEAILADGSSAPVRWMARGVLALVKRTYRSINLMVDLGPCMRRRLSQYDHNARRETLTPWALFEPDAPEQPDLSVRRSMFGDVDLALLYSGNMGKAHDFMPFLHLARVLNRINPRIVFCFACRGNRTAELKQALTSRDTNIRLIPFADESQLGKQLCAADIHLLSLRSEWEGIVVPSKFFGSLAVGRPVIYAGPADSSIAAWVRELDLGLLLTGRNFRDVTERILAIAKDPHVLASWQTNAFEAYQHYFARKNIMDAWDTALRDELERGFQPRSSKVSVISGSQSDKSTRAVTGA